jgi:hypothetical protein
MEVTRPAAAACESQILGSIAWNVLRYPMTSRQRAQSTFWILLSGSNEAGDALRAEPRCRDFLTSLVSNSIDIF